MDFRQKLQAARLYLVCSSLPNLDELLDSALPAGVDIIQLRDHDLGSDEEIIAAARPFRAAADKHNALFILNDRPDLVTKTGADGVHLGQEDLGPAQARAIIGPDAIIGRSTHSPEQAAEAQADPDVDYLSIGPVYETPTKPGRPATGLEYVSYAQANVMKPWFAIGGVNLDTIEDVVQHGAGRAVIVRAIVDEADPAAAVKALRAKLEAN